MFQVLKFSLGFKLDILVSDSTGTVYYVVLLAEQVYCYYLLITYLLRSDNTFPISNYKLFNIFKLLTKFIF